MSPIPRKFAHLAQTLGRVIQKIPLYEMSIPRNYKFLDVARQLILETVLR